MIGPLLVLLLADGESLITQCVPPALRRMSVDVLRAVFGTVLAKPVHTLEFDRSFPASARAVRRITRRLEIARAERAVVLTTPESVKSLFLRYVELLNIEANAPDMVLQAPKAVAKALQARASGEREQYAHRALAADELGRLMRLWSAEEKGVLLMDEVDLLLHPLRSELNFPVGETQPLDLDTDRWMLPIHLLVRVCVRGGRGTLCTQLPPSRRCLNVSAGPGVRCARRALLLARLRGDGGIGQAAAGVRGGGA